MTTPTALVRSTSTGALHNAITLWADATTAPASARRGDLLRDKTAMVGAFFGYTGKPPELVTEIDVKAWQAELEGRGLAASTVYGYLSRLSSFYEWALQDPALAQRIGRNPVRLARPKVPPAYQAESTQALTDDELRELLRVVKRRADAGDVVGKRDYAMLAFLRAHRHAARGDRRLAMGRCAAGRDVDDHGQGQGRRVSESRSRRAGGEGGAGGVSDGGRPVGADAR